jgi:hypothetical protein
MVESALAHTEDDLKSTVNAFDCTLDVTSNTSRSA